MLAKNLVKEAFMEIMKELRPKDNFPGYSDNWESEPEFNNPEIPGSSQNPNRDDSLAKQAKPSHFGNKLGDVSTKLAQAKGELNTILDRAAREGIIKKDGGRIAILNKNEYIKRVGNLPKQIKALQNQLEPQTNASNLE